jgi:hypothetical protein
VEGIVGSEGRSLEFEWAGRSFCFGLYLVLRT